MILVDANLLIHAYNPRSADHAAARAWLERALSRRTPIRLAWITLWAFLRITTHPRVFEYPFSIDEAGAIIDSWLAHPAVSILEPGDRHWSVLRDLAGHTQAVGPLMMDAVLAALAFEHGATLATTDRDFARFPDLRWENPLAG
ncbi:MAG TPA: TA system VapC family ribonuclease toxin [Vicinamibacterales bacterium]|nr:TA system VapC family ribonuclease toxin [Vicinamibacterales bacterium]